MTLLTPLFVATAIKKLWPIRSLLEILPKQLSRRGVKLVFVR
jgi:hypothetical protein